MSWHGVPQGVDKLPGQMHSDGLEDQQGADGFPIHRARGTMILVMVFLAAFIVYYFVNWKLLSFIWKVG